MMKDVTILTFDEVEQIRNKLDHAQRIAQDVANGSLPLSNINVVIEDLICVQDMFR